MLEKYLERIGLPGPPPTTEQGLFLLHYSQAFAIPFENLSVFIGDPVSLEPGALVDKLVTQKRGGYCFELNGLFAWALREFKFDAETHLARVQVHNPEPGPLTHQLIVAQLGKNLWLCDVGFGGPGLHHPMPLELDRIESQGGDEFRLKLDADFGYSLEHKQPDDTWQIRYMFHTRRTLPIDITMANHFTSTWEGSIFKKWIMCAKPTQQGKITLYNQDLKRRKEAELFSEKVATGAQLLEVLKTQFQIDLDAGRAELLTKEFEKRIQA